MMGGLSKHCELLGFGSDINDFATVLEAIFTIEVIGHNFFVY